MAEKNEWENALHDLQEVAGLLDLSSDVLTVLCNPRRVLNVSLPVRLDDGSVKVFQGYRVQHSLDRGPAKGGLRFAPDVTLDEVRALVNFATGGLTPDMTILMDIDVKAGLERKMKNGAEWNRLDAYTVEFHQRVRAGYLEMAKQEPDRWVVVDASRGWNEVQEELRRVIGKRLEIRY